MTAEEEEYVLTHYNSTAISIYRLKRKLGLDVPGVIYRFRRGHDPWPDDWTRWVPLRWPHDR